MIDVCIVSDAKNDRLKEMTKQAIKTSGNTCYVSEGQQVKYDCVTVNRLDVSGFNYNRTLNQLAALGNQEYIAFCNNDLIFHEGWDKEIIECMNEANVVSASPWCTVAHEMIHGNVNYRYKQGYHTRRYLAGWCFVWRREFWEKHRLPEEYEFWCADNATEKALRKAQKGHILCRNAVVVHLGGVTTRTLPKDKQTQLTKGCVQKWNKENNVNLFGWGKKNT